MRDANLGRCRGCRRRRSQQCSRRRCYRRGRARWRRRVRNRLRPRCKRGTGRNVSHPRSRVHGAVDVRTGAVAGRAGDRAERAGVAGALGHVGGAQLRRARASGAREAARRRRLARLRVVRADGAACSGKRTDPRVSVWTPGRTSKGGVWLRAVLVHDVEVVALVLYVPAPHTVS